MVKTRKRRQTRGQQQPREEEERTIIKKTKKKKRSKIDSENEEALKALKAAEVRVILVVKNNFSREFEFCLWKHLSKTRDIFERET